MLTNSRSLEYHELVVILMLGQRDRAGEIDVVNQSGLVLNIGDVDEHDGFVKLQAALHRDALGVQII